MRYSPGWLPIITLFIPAILLPGAVGRGGAPADNPTNYVLTEDALNKTLGALGDLRAKNLPIHS